MSTWILLAIGVVGVLSAVIVLGALLPQSHVVSKTCYLEAAPEELWRIITDFDAQPVWRSDVRFVERLTSPNGKELWREFRNPRSYATYETTEASPPFRLVRRIADEGLPFGGDWTFDISPTTHGCQLRITEHGNVKNPFFRFVSRFVIGHTRSLENYCRSLERVLGNKNAAERLRTRN